MTAAIAFAPPQQTDPIPPLPAGGRLPTPMFGVPRWRPTMAARPRLLDTIAAADAPLTVVCAPVGYGKSTLVTQWLVGSALPAAWISLDTSDDEPRVFFGLIASALQSIDHAIA